MSTGKDIDVLTMVRSVIGVLVDEESAIDLRVVAGSANSVIEVRLAERDYGKMIGRGGTHVQALRTLLNAAARKYDRIYTLSVIDPPSRRAQSGTSRER